MNIAADGKTQSQPGSDKQLTPGPSIEQTEWNQDKKRVIYMLVNHLGIKFRDEDHRKEVIAEFSLLSYRELIRPLVIEDKKKNKLSLGKLTQKYQCNLSTIRYILDKIDPDK